MLKGFTVNNVTFIFWAGLLDCFITSFVRALRLISLIDRHCQQQSHQETHPSIPTPFKVKLLVSVCWYLRSASGSCCLPHCKAKTERWIDEYSIWLTREVCCRLRLIIPNFEVDIRNWRSSNHLLQSLCSLVAISMLSLCSSVYWRAWINSNPTEVMSGKLTGWGWPWSFSWSCCHTTGGGGGRDGDDSEDAPGRRWTRTMSFPVLCRSSFNLKTLLSNPKAGGRGSYTKGCVFIFLAILVLHKRYFINSACVKFSLSWLIPFLQFRRVWTWRTQFIDATKLFWSVDLTEQKYVYNLLLGRYQQVADITSITVHHKVNLM